MLPAAPLLRFNLIRVAGNPSAVKTAAGHSSDLTRRNQPNPVVAGIRNVDLGARWIDSDAGWIIECRRSGGNPFTFRIAAAAGNRAHQPRLVDHADAIVAAIGHIHCSLRIHGDSGRRGEERFKRRLITVERIGAGHVAYQASDGIELANPIIGPVREVQNTVGIERQAVRVIHRSEISKVTVATVTAGSGSHHSLNGPGGAIDHADALIVAVGEYDVPGGVHQDSRRSGE